MSDSTSLPARLIPLLIALSLLFPLSGIAKVIRITIDGPIHPIVEEYVERAVAAAEREKADALLIELRTPGGLESSTRKIVHQIVSSPVPVIIWVTPSGSRAASAGFFILESADVAAMAPGTNTGAAHPVLLVGQDKIDDVMKKKIENDSAAFMRSIASKRGRNVKIAESAVRESTSMTDEEALKDGVIDYVARDQKELFAKVSSRPVRRFDGSTVKLSLVGDPVEDRGMTLKQRLLAYLMDPNIAFILFSVGMLGIWAELSHPGAIFPGVVGGIAILLSVFAFNLLPTSYAAVLLIVAAFVLFALEAKFASHGVLGIGGVVCMVFGALLLVDGPIPEMRVKLITALAVSIPFGIIAVFLMSLALRARRGRVVTGEQGMIGEVGVARTPLDPSGRIFVHGELWNARSIQPVGTGSKVIVTAIEGLELTVAPLIETIPAAGGGETSSKPPQPPAEAHPSSGTSGPN
ncbi:MAG: nodulation protein NfeD [Thermoanaerobaculia bacterium]